MTVRFARNSPTSLLRAATFIDSAGSGLFLSASAVFFTRHLGLSGARVGLGMSLAGVVAMVLGTPLAGLADRFSARNLRIALDLWRAAAILGFLLVDGFWGYVVVLTLMMTADRVSFTTFQVLVGGLVRGEGRVLTMARMRVAFNAGFSVGALLAGGALLWSGEGSFVAVVVTDSLTFLLATSLVALLPDVLPQGAERRSAGGWQAVLHDRWYLTLTTANGALSLHQSLIGVAIPVWVATRSGLPGAMVPAIALLNTVLAVTLQVRAARGATTLAGASRAIGRSCWTLSAGCLVLALAATGLRPWGVLVVTVVATVLITCGELLQSAGAWNVAYDLAPVPDRAKFISVFDLSGTAEKLVGPALLTAVVLPAGAPGWIGVAVLIAVSGLVARLAVARHQRYSFATVAPLEETTR